MDTCSFEEIQSALHNNGGVEIAERLAKLSDDQKEKLFYSNYETLDDRVLDKVVLSLPATSLVKALQFLSKEKKDNIVEVFGCIIREHDRDSLDPEEILSAKIVEAALRGSQLSNDTNLVRLYFHHEAIGDWIGFGKLVAKVLGYSKGHTLTEGCKEIDYVTLAPVLFSKDDDHWQLLVFKPGKSFYHFNFEVGGIFKWRKWIPDIRCYYITRKIEKSFQSGLYVIQLAEYLMETLQNDPDTDILAESGNPDIFDSPLDSYDILRFLRLDGLYNCHNKYCLEYFDTKAEKKMHEGICELAEKNIRLAWNNVEKAKALLEMIPEVNKDAFVMSKDSCGKTWLHQIQDDNICKLLIENVSKRQRDGFIISKDDTGKTALHVTQNEKVAELLIQSVSENQRDAFIIMQDDEQKTALHYSTTSSLVDLLLSHTSNSCKHGLLLSSYQTLPREVLGKLQICLQITMPAILHMTEDKKEEDTILVMPHSKSSNPGAGQVNSSADSFPTKLSSPYCDSVVEGVEQAKEVIKEAIRNTAKEKKHLEELELQRKKHPKELQGKKHLEELQMTKHLEELQRKKHLEELQRKKHLEELQGKKHLEELQGKKHLEELQRKKHLEELQRKALLKVYKDLQRKVTEDVIINTERKGNDRRTQVTEAMATSYCLNPQAVQVAAIEPSGKSLLTKLYADNIRMVIESNRLEDIPVVVIAIAGKSRRGKSYLLSVMTAYLEHLSKSPHKPFQSSPSDISAMKWTSGRSAVTKGIWLSEKSYTIERKDNSKVAVLLLDTQGICDDTQSAHPMVDSQIIYMTLSMATIYIHNVSKDFQMPEKKVYQICKSYSEVCGESNQSDDERPLFNSFTLLVRDWTIDNNYGARPDIFRKEIKKAEGNEEASKIMHGIDKLFENKTAWVFPVPSEALQESDGNISLEEAGEKFRDCVLLFLKALFSPAGEYNKQMDGAVTGKMFVEMLDVLAERLAYFPDPASDHLKDFFIRKAYHSAKKIFDDSLKSMSTMQDLQALTDRRGQAEDFAKESFITQVQKYKPDEKILSCYLYQLRKAIKDEKDIFMAHKKLEAEKGCREDTEKENQILTRGLVKYAAAGAGVAAGAAVIGAAVAAGPAVISAVAAGAVPAVLEVVATAAKNPIVQQAAVAIGKAIIRSKTSTKENKKE